MTSGALLLVTNVLCLWTQQQQPVVATLTLSLPKLCLPTPKAAAAAKINAEIQARKAIQHIDVPPIRSVGICPFTASAPLTSCLKNASPLPTASSPSAGQSTSNLNGEIYIADGDYIKDIEVNDLRNRYTLTKGSTQKTVNILVMSQLIFQAQMNIP
jgi:hypothetical protein